MKNLIACLLGVTLILHRLALVLPGQLTTIRMKTG
jgi:hypothetical protein